MVVFSLWNRLYVDFFFVKLVEFWIIFMKLFIYLFFGWNLLHLAFCSWYLLYIDLFLFVKAWMVNGWMVILQTSYMLIYSSWNVFYGYFSSETSCRFFYKWNFSSYNKKTKFQKEKSTYNKFHEEKKNQHTLCFTNEESACYKLQEHKTSRHHFSRRTRAKSSYGTCDEVRRAKSLYGMSSSKILRMNRLL